MRWTLEVVVVPVADLDRAKAFYTDAMGFVADLDESFGTGERVVQLTPPGSGCSISLQQGTEAFPPGSLRGLQLVVNDVREARRVLAARGAEVSEVQAYDRAGRLHPALPDQDLDNVGFCFLSDPDGNGWAVQQMSDRG